MAERPPEPRQSLRLHSRRKRRRCGSTIRFGVTRGFDQVQAHLRAAAAAPTTEEATRSAGNRRTPGSGQPPAGAIEPPSSRYTSYTEGDLFQVSVPSNWRELPGTTPSRSRPRAPTARSTVRASSRTASRSGRRATSRTTCRPRPTSSSAHWRAEIRTSGAPQTTLEPVSGTATACARCCRTRQRPRDGRKQLRCSRRCSGTAVCST